MTLEPRLDIDEIKSSVDSILTPGAMLQKEREKRGLDIKTASSQLRISRAKLMALESDSYDQFPGETFIRGYLRSYSRLLSLPEEDVLKHYQDYVAANVDVQQLIQSHVSPRVLIETSRIAGIKSVYFVIGVAVALGILVLAFVYFYSTLPEDSAAMVKAQAPQAVIGETVVPGGVNAEADEQVVAGNDSVEVPIEQVAPDTPVDSPAPQVVGTELDTLTLVFSEECWVEVSDAKGDVLATELQSVGSELVLRGKAPFNVMLGNARAASLSINGVAVDASPRASNRALRFSVDKPN